MSAFLINVSGKDLGLPHSSTDLVVGPLTHTYFLTSYRDSPAPIWNGLDEFLRAKDPISFHIPKKLGTVRVRNKPADIAAIETLYVDPAELGVPLIRTIGSKKQS